MAKIKAQMVQETKAKEAEFEKKMQAKSREIESNLEA